MSEVMIHLKPLSEQDGMDIYEMLQHIGENENGFHNAVYGQDYVAFQAYLREQAESARGENLRAGYVPQSTFWAYAGNRPVGVIKIRHYLTPSLLRVGGHIGYAVRADARGRGYASAMLAQAIEIIRGMGVQAVLITVNDTNIASCRVAEKNGFVAQGGPDEDGHLHYWLSIAQG